MEQPTKGGRYLGRLIMLNCPTPGNSDIFDIGLNLC
jgi:hypothetical protein